MLAKPVARASLGEDDFECIHSIRFQPMTSEPARVLHDAKEVGAAKAASDVVEDTLKECGNRACDANAIPNQRPGQLNRCGKHTLDVREVWR